jgi:glycosyltransferase involved in cell wall biosynthesis
LTPELSVVVPCYNEAAALPRLLADFAAAGAGKDFELILVDNGSSDATPEVLARELAGRGFARALRVEPNGGYGGGILAGLAAARGRYRGWTHADLQFPAAAVFEAHGKARALGPRALVKGLRLNRPFGDRFFTAGLGLAYSLLLGSALRDMGGQPTVFSAGLLDGARPPSDYSLDAFTLALALKKGWRVERFGVPVALRDFSASRWNTGFLSRLRLAGRYLAAVPALRAALKEAGTGL